MATRKKKETATMEMPGTIGGAKVVLPKEKKTKQSKSSDGWPKITVGTHLTVKTFEDGHTELVWDDEALLQEVREAIQSTTVTPTKKKVKGK